MKPVKSLLPIAKWLLRAAAVAIVYSSNQIDLALSFSFKGLTYILALGYTITVVLLIIGSFLKTSKLTVISSLLLLIVCITDLVVAMGFSFPNLLYIFPLASIGFYFMTQGNQS